MADPVVVPESDGGPRLLFRYITVGEWRDYRAIMASFAGTFFAEFTPEDVQQRLRAYDIDLDLVLVSSRLESLRAWGNLTVSSSVGSPVSLDDYYRRRNRYLITRAGQEVADVVEGVLTTVDEVRDVSTGRLRALRDALAALRGLDVSTTEGTVLADAVRAVFDPHATFTLEITQFFAAINQWQSRYDLTPDELRFFAEVLVGYVSERLDEIERTSRPIGRHLAELQPLVGGIVSRLASGSAAGLAGRIEQAGITGISASRVPGSTLDDWANLAAWFVASGRTPSRIERLGQEAVAAIRTLTINLTRLSRVGIGASSRRAEFVRLAGLFDTLGSPATGPDGRTVSPHRLAAAAFAMFPARHFGMAAEDVDDPVASSTPWANAPRALVPVSLRERGKTSALGTATPLRDRRQEQQMVRLQREAQRADEQAVELELALLGSFSHAVVSVAALRRLQQLIGRTCQRIRFDDGVPVAAREWTDGSLRCMVTRAAGARTTIASPDGILTLHDLQLSIDRAPA